MHAMYSQRQALLPDGNSNPPVRIPWLRDLMSPSRSFPPHECLVGFRSGIVYAVHRTTSEPKNERGLNSARDALELAQLCTW